MRNFFSSILHEPYPKDLGRYLYFYSVHGKHTELVGLIRRHKKVFSILGTSDGIAELAEKLIALGLKNVRMYTGERLSYEDEKIRQGGPEDFLGYEPDSLSVDLCGKFRL